MVGIGVINLSASKQFCNPVSLVRRAAQSAIDEVPASFQDDEDSKEEESLLLPTIKRHNIFHTVLNSSLPSPVKTPTRLGQEGFVAIAARGETCARMMSNAFYYISTNWERVVPTLMAELKTVMPTPEVVPDLRCLEQLPYLVRPPTHLHTQQLNPSLTYSNPSLRKKDPQTKSNFPSPHPSRPPSSGKPSASPPS